MQIVIDVSEKEYNYYRDASNFWGYSKLREIILNGTPLPRGHGRLVDADALEKKMCDREEELRDDKALWESSAVSVALDMFAPTIIEADNKEE